MSGFTVLERDVLDGFCVDHPDLDLQLRRVLSTAQVVSRENTGHGFYTDFETALDLPALESASNPLSRNHCCEISVGHEILIMDFLLWTENGRPTCLEGFQFATKDGRSLDLNRWDLATLRLIA